MLIITLMAYRFIQFATAMLRRYPGIARGRARGGAVKSNDSAQPHRFSSSSRFPTNLPPTSSNTYEDSHGDASNIKLNLEHLETSSKCKDDAEMDQFDFSVTESGLSSNLTNSNKEAEKDKCPEGPSEGKSSHEEWVNKVQRGTPTYHSHMSTDKENLHNLEELWQQHPVQSRNNVILPAIRQCFQDSPHPYETALYLTSNCRDVYTQKQTSLAFMIIREFERWINAKGNPANSTMYKHLLNEDVQRRAFYLGTRYHMLFFEFILKAFQLKHQGNDYLLPYLKEMFSRKDLHKCALCIGKLGLQEHFDIKEVLIPLLVEDKVNVVESYVADNKEQQIALLNFLDQLCSSQIDLLELIKESGASLEKVRLEKLRPKPISKLAARLMKKYQIPPEACPNISNNKSLAGIRYLMYKRYIEKTMDNENWDDFIQSAVGDNVWLQEQLVDQFVNYMDLTEAVKWAKFYQLPNDKIPCQVIDAMNSHMAADSTDASWETECYDDADVQASYYYTFPLSGDRIVFVDTAHAFYECLKTICQPGNIIGIDAEWKPQFVAGKNTRISIMQLALGHVVYILDMIKLCEVLPESAWNQMATDLFCSTKVTKLGYGFTSDMTMLEKSIPGIKTQLQKTANLIDLQTLHRMVSREAKSSAVPQASAVPTIDSEEDSDDGGDVIKLKPQTQARVKVNKKEEKGLSALVNECMGRPLCKSQTMSNWERRPLDQKQIDYAAQDAYVLLEVYECLQQQIKDNKMNINVNQAMVLKKHSVDKKNTPKEKRGVPSHYKSSNRGSKHLPKKDVKPVSPSKLSLVVDTMLQGLGRQLRLCGVDVKILGNTQDHQEAIKICLSENRIILTQGSPYNMLVSHVGPHMCMQVTPGKADEQVQEVLEYFNVKVSEQDILSRCMDCNNDTYIELQQEEFIKLLEVRHELLRSKTDQVFPIGYTSRTDTQHLTESGVDFTKVTYNNVPLLLEKVPNQSISTIQVYYCCKQCGKVYWEGPHWKSTIDKLSGVLK